MEAATQLEIGPQPGPQHEVLASPADIVISGGAAGGGKTWGLLLDPIRNYHNKAFRGVIFRRQSTQIRNPGGLWDESLDLYGSIGGVPKDGPLEWQFPSGMAMKFAHMEYEKDRLSWDGAQLPWIGFDQLESFTEKQFWYMFSRLRSKSGVRGVIRATMNPNPDSFVRKLIDWWIGKDGFAIPERSGVIRFFHKDGDVMCWGDSREELVKKFGKECDPKSFTFIPSTVYDNKILLDKDPGYLSNLKAMQRVERERLLKGNHNIRPAAGNYFKREWFKIIDTMPKVRSTVRFWDRAATEKVPTNEPDWTAGVKVSVSDKGDYIVSDVVKFRHSPGRRDDLIKRTGSHDRIETTIGLEQEPGASGKAEIEYMIKQLSGYIVKAYPATRDKVTRSGPVSSQVEAGNVYLLRGSWNDDFMDELENFPDGRHDDQVDGFSGAFNMVANNPMTQVMMVKGKQLSAGMRDREF